MARPGAGAASSAIDWDALYADALPRIYRFFCYRIGEGATAEDLTSATFEKAWKGRARYREDVAGFTTWLYAIARNVAVDHFRARRISEPLDAHTPSGDPSPLEQAERADNFARLTALLAQLPARDREVLALKHGAGLPHREIAQMLGLSENNIAVIAHRAAERLRAQWPKESP